MTLRAFRGDQFGFLPELFAINSCRFYHNLSTVKESITLHAPHRSVVVAFICLVHGQRAIAPAVYQLCLDWDVALPILDTVRASLGHSKLGVAVNRGGSPDSSSTSYPIRGKTVRCRSPDIRRDREKMRTRASGAISL
jgi:hypothetical protein